MTKNWKLAQPGTLVLDGTIMSIVYRDAMFCIYQGDRYRWQTATLTLAKLDAERLHAELVEIGVEEQ